MALSCQNQACLVFDNSSGPRERPLHTLQHAYSGLFHSPLCALSFCWALCCALVVPLDPYMYIRVRIGIQILHYFDVCKCHFHMYDGHFDRLRGCVLPVLMFLRMPVLTSYHVFCLFWCFYECLFWHLTKLFLSLFLPFSTGCFSAWPFGSLFCCC